VPRVLYFRTGTSSSQVIVGLELGIGLGSALVSSSYNIEEHITSNIYNSSTL